MIADIEPTILRSAARHAQWPSVGDPVGLLDQHTFYAFQPIVSIHTGTTFGFEALLRGHGELGASSVATLLDDAFEHGYAVEVDRVLRRKAIRGFRDFVAGSTARLFYNLDNRLLTLPDFDPEENVGLLAEAGMQPSQFCTEISEAQALGDVLAAARRLRAGGTDMPLAIDDFGTGFSGLQLLHELRPEIVKIDRFFISDIDASRRKKAFLVAIVNLAHSLGISVIAEGVENDRELTLCREIGCDMVQGYFVARPTSTSSQLLPHYAVVADEDAVTSEATEDEALIAASLDRVAPISMDDPLSEVVEWFRQDPDRSFVPVIDRSGDPFGIVQDTGIRPLVQSPFGRALLANAAQPFRLRDFLTRCLVLDIATPLDQLLDGSELKGSGGTILFTKAGRYVGALSAASMLTLARERSARALAVRGGATGLPGAGMLTSRITARLASQAGFIVLRFRLPGLRALIEETGLESAQAAIRLLSDTVVSLSPKTTDLIAHISLDMVFVVLPGLDVRGCTIEARAMMDAFLASMGRRDPVSAGPMRTTFSDPREGLVRAEILIVPPSAGQIRIETVRAALMQLRFAQPGSTEAAVLVGALAPDGVVSVTLAPVLETRSSQRAKIRQTA